MNNNSIIISITDYLDICNRMVSNHNYNIKKTIIIPERFVPKHTIKNTVYTKEHVQNNNCFLEYYDVIKSQLLNAETDKIIFIIPNEQLKDICEPFKNLNNIEYFILPYYAFENKGNLISYLIKIDVLKPRLRAIQINVSQHCNLNCKGCANYSNLVEEPSYYSLEQFIKDATQLKKLFWGIEQIKLMGGEPLLNDKLVDFIKISREIFRDSKIVVGTNGLSINSSKSQLFKTMRENHAEFLISIYPKYTSKIEEYKKLLSNYEVKYDFLIFKGKFMKYLYEFPFWEAEKGYSYCPAKECHCLENGIIAVCARPLYLNRLNFFFGLSIPDQEGKWNIYELSFDSWELDKLLRTPFITCSYCGPKQLYDWTVCPKSNVKKEDWIVDISDS